MLPPGEWAWFLDRAHGVYDHLVVGASLPWLLPPGIHHLEAWNERLADLAPALGGGRSPSSCGGPWTWSTGRRSGARSRRSAELFARLGAGPARHDRRPGRRRSGVPAAGVDQRALRRRAPLVRGPGPVRATEVTTPVHQLTCSPIHNQVPAGDAAADAAGLVRAARPGRSGRWPARPGVRRPAVRWRKAAGPYFGNAVGTLLHRGRAAEVVIEGTTKDGADLRSGGERDRCTCERPSEPQSPYARTPDRREDR